MRTETRRVGTRMCRQRCYAGAGVGVPDLDCAVPGGGEKRVFGHEIPVYGEDFARVFLP
jgi:hypothetical protein